jgi:hypothetical protein
MPKITLTRPNVYQMCGVTLIAGDNDVTAQQLATLEKQSGFKRDVERGVLVVEKAKRGRPPKAEAVDPEPALTMPEAE